MEILKPSKDFHSIIPYDVLCRHESFAVHVFVLDQVFHCWGMYKAIKLANI